MNFHSKEFKDDIRRKRIIELDLSMDACCALIGISKATLSRCESGILPEIKTYYLVCNWLGVSLDYYFREDKCEYIEQRKQCGYCGRIEPCEGFYPEGCLFNHKTETT